MKSVIFRKTWQGKSKETERGKGVGDMKARSWWMNMEKAILKCRRRKSNKSRFK